ncbi:uncharacterized protein LOC133296154 [Gastrolobium bilobum]|uniref:uncharacterized protein LOC133296154 n=1 Tax=Gastrolobium bilobum TaxID=150636 RepID=UPI002AB0A845|nr:uncharacterized protein LOC133296154 [Gastrolobium bilobum]
MVNSRRTPTTPDEGVDPMKAALIGMPQAIRDLVQELRAGKVDRVQDFNQQGARPAVGVDQHWLIEFRKHQPPSFLGEYDPDAAAKWLRDLTKIFRVMECSDSQRVNFATYMLQGNADWWWDGVKAQLEQQGTEITWQVFEEAFLNKYFSRDVCSYNVREQKEMDFGALKQGSMTIDEYTTKFEDLAQYTNEGRSRSDEQWLVSMYKRNLRPELQFKLVGFLIKDLTTLINTCIVLEQWEETKKARVSGPDRDEQHKGVGQVKGKALQLQVQGNN